MRIAVISDAHLVSPNDSFKDIHIRRSHFAKAWPSFKKMIAKIRAESPDLVISLGDLVEWYSKENVEFAISLMDELQSPWVMTPGNHDFEIYKKGQNKGELIGPFLTLEEQQQAMEGWQRNGVDLNQRVIDAGDTGLVLLNSAISQVEKGTEQWLGKMLNKHKHNMVFTHVPLDITVVRDYILSVEPDKNMKKYVQSGSPWIFENCFKNKVECVFSSHLHFSGDITVDSVRLYMLGLSVQAVGRNYRNMGMSMIVDTDHFSTRIIRI